MERGLVVSSPVTTKETGCLDREIESRQGLGWYKKERKESKGHSLVEEDIVLRAEPDRLPDLVHRRLDVQPVDLGRASGRGEHAGQDGAGGKKSARR
jgi:hypothetical protein